MKLTFTEALSAMIDGKTARPLSWEGYGYDHAIRLASIDSMYPIFVLVEKYANITVKIMYSREQYQLSAKDILDDWEIVDWSNCKTVFK